jgi:adhesin/invasin
VTADNASLITVTVTALDGSSQPVSGAAVTVSLSPANGTVTAVQATTDASGVATFTLKDATAEVVTVTAVATGVTLTQQPVVTFTPGAPAASPHSTLTAPTTLAAGATGTFAVLLRDANNNPVSGETVTFGATPTTGNTFSSGNTCVTGAAGTCSVPFQSTKAEVKSVTATDGALVLTATVTVTHGQIDSSTYNTLAVSPASGVVGDGLDRARHTFKVQDAHGNPIAGVSVTASMDTGLPSDVFFASSAQSSDANGLVHFDVQAPSLGTKSVVFSFAGLTPVDTESVTFVATRTLPAWVQQPAMTTPREGFGFTLGSDGLIYALGGRDSGGASAVVEAFDPLLNSWSTLAPLPKTQALPAAVTFGGTILVMGGYGDVSTQEVQTLSGTTYGTGPSLSTGRNFAAATVCGGAAVIAGGFATGFTTSVEINSTGSSWVGVSNLLTARNALGLACVGNTLYAIGGLNSPSGTNQVLNVVETSTVGSSSWSAGTPMLTARNELTTVVGPDGRIYAIGGNTSPTGSAPLSTVEAYDPAEDAWFTTVGLTTARRSHGAVVAPSGQIVVFGGAPEASSPATEFYGPAVSSSAVVGSFATLAGSNFAALADVTVVDVASGSTVGTATTSATGTVTVSIDLTALTGVRKLKVVDDRSHYPVTLSVTN